MEQAGNQNRDLPLDLLPIIEEIKVKEVGKPKQKRIRKNKKENDKNRRKLKKYKKVESRSDISDEDYRMPKHKSDQDISVTTHQSVVLKIKIPTHAFLEKRNSQLHRLIAKPPYVSLSGYTISGEYGHSSAIFKRPIIQGNYYLEIMIKEECKKNRNVQNPATVRVGICNHSFNFLFPLGCQESIAYKSTDGSFVRNGQKIAQGQPYTINDVIGVLMKISPPHKRSDPNQINEDSSVSFFKNGKLIKQFSDLKQIFYCFGVSLYNYSQVQILPGPQSRYPLPIDSNHYFSSLNQKILYKDLQDNKIFKI